VSDAVRILRLEAGSRFEISSLQHGDYRIQAATIDSQTESVSVQVRANETVDLRLRLMPRVLQ
jgi:hypothetical protein